MARMLQLRIALGACLLFVGCQSNVEENVGNPFSTLLSPAFQTISPRQEISTREAARILTLNLDNSGNGFVSSASSGTELYVIQDFQYQQRFQPLFYSFFLPTIFWEGSGKGEIIFLASNTFQPGFFTSTPSRQMREPLKLTSAQISDYQKSSEPQTFDYKEPGMELITSTPIINREGTGYLSGTLRPRISQDPRHVYSLAYIPINSHRLQGELVKLKDTVYSEKLPFAWFNQSNGLILLNSKNNDWGFKEIRQHQIGDSETNLGSSSLFPYSYIDQNGDGFIALWTSSSELKIHQFQGFKHIKSETITATLPQGTQFELAFSNGKGLLVTYTLPVSLSSNSSVNMQCSSIENGQIKNTKHFAFSLKERLPFGAIMKVNKNGRGLFVLGTGPKGSSKGTLHLFPIHNFMLQP